MLYVIQGQTTAVEVTFTQIAGHGKEYVCYHKLNSEYREMLATDSRSVGNVED